MVISCSKEERASGELAAIGEAYLASELTREEKLAEFTHQYEGLAGKYAGTQAAQEAGAWLETGTSAVEEEEASGELEAIEREDITWPSFWDGEDTDGPISTKWGVFGWPVIYILDHEGIIREKNKRAEKMDEVVDRLLEEIRPG